MISNASLCAIYCWFVIDKNQNHEITLIDTKKLPARHHLISTVTVFNIPENLNGSL